MSRNGTWEKQVVEFLRENRHPVREMVQRIAKARGVVVDDQRADDILWNHTGFPSFWHTANPVRECRRQVRAFFRFGPGCIRCGGRPLVDDMFCGGCAEEMR